MLGLLFSLAALSGRALAISQDIIEQAKKEGEAVLDTTMPVGEFQIFNQAAKEKYPFLNIRPCASTDIDRLLDSGNLHVIRTEGEYSRYMKLYNEVLGTL